MEVVMLASFTIPMIEKIFQVGVKLDNNCYRDSYKRIAQARLAVNRTLPQWNPNSRFCRIWGSLILNDRAWLNFPRQYRGLGAPGALAMVGWSQIIRGPQIWNGSLKPGAVVQAWSKPEFYRAVRDGNKPIGLLGHSFVFIRYERNRKGDILGLHVADNNYHGRAIVGIHQWAVLIGANTVS